MKPRYQVTRAAFTPSGVDAQNMPIDGWSAGEAVPSYGWWSPSSDDQPTQDNRDAVVRDLDLLIPHGCPAKPRDQWTVAGVLYEQIGWPQDYNHGPFGTSVPVVVFLKRTEG